MNDPLNIIAEDDVRIASGYEVKIALCGKAEIAQAISKYYSEDYMRRIVKLSATLSLFFVKCF